jgi:hypothetical protein
VFCEQKALRAKVGSYSDKFRLIMALASLLEPVLPLLTGLSLNDCLYLFLISDHPSVFSSLSMRLHQTTIPVDHGNLYTPMEEEVNMSSEICPRFFVVR